MFLKKPLFWDYKKVSLISFLLLPFTIPVVINNYFSKFFLKSKPKDIFTICVGNIYVGGTGKTPLTIKIYDILKNTCNKIVTAKKFNRKYIDEIKLLKLKSKFITHQDRISILKKAINNKVKIIIFDDGLQEKSIDYNLKIVCFDGKNWIGNGQLLPAGPLREKINSLKKYDCVILKNLPRNNSYIIDKIQKINKNIKIFNSKYEIKNIDKYDLKKKYLIFSGIANNQDFKKILECNKFKIVHNFNFSDHHKYELTQIEKIIKYAKLKNLEILTTEKDFMKIPKFFHRKIKCVKIDVKIEKYNNFKKFLKKKIYA